MDATIPDAPKLSSYEAIARGAVTTCQNRGHVSDEAFRNVAESGIRTMRLRYKTVNPRESPNPGKTLRCLSLIFIYFLHPSGSQVLLIRLINLIEHPAVSEMSLLGLLPIADDFRKRKQLHFWKLAGIFLCDDL